MAEQQEGKNKRQRRIYSTQIINQLIMDKDQGYDIDFEPFFQRDSNLRAANIPFKMTDEEMEEYQKCYDDPIYYAENYAKFMTDYGYSVVDLRPYQRNIIGAVTEETYDEKRDLILPVNRNIILCCSRQVGKCVSPCTSINYKDYNLSCCKRNSIFEIEDKYIKKTIIKKIKNFLYKVYNLL